MPCKEKILFFYLNTGNGHLAPAKALRDSIEQISDNKYKVVLVDALKESPKIIRTIMEDGYRKGISSAIWVYELWYLLMLIKPLRDFTHWLISISVKGYVKKCIFGEKPDKVIIFHSLIIKPVIETVKEENYITRPKVLITDPFTAAPSWFQYRDLDFITFSDKVIQKRNISYKKFPMVLNRKFKPSNINKQNLKKELGFNPEKNLILLIGGGDGLPKLIPIMNNILESKPDYQIACVCGRNRDQYKRILKIKDKYSDIDIKLYGFINNVYELSIASDLAITKAGASTIMELLLTETIPIITRYIWGQEKGNRDFIVNNNLGFYEKNPKKLPYLINMVLHDNEILSGTVQNIRDMNLLNGTDLVANHIIS